MLQREELLRERLDSLVQRGALDGYQAVSSWVPSLARQRSAATLVTERMLGAAGPLGGLRRELGEDEVWEQSVRANLPAATPVTVQSFLASPVSEPLRMLWVGGDSSESVSVVTLKGVVNEQLPALEAAAQQIEGVTWADKVAGISSVLGRYRVRMSWVLAASYLIIWCIFLPRYGRRAWRILAPSVCASAVALAVIGLAGQPLQLFHVLALYLVFGLGVDYAIFLSEQTPESEGDVSFAVGLAAASTVLSLGLLALSETPVLRAFGLTMLVGVTVSLLAAPLFCQGSRRTVPRMLNQVEE